MKYFIELTGPSQGISRIGPFTEKPEIVVSESGAIKVTVWMFRKNNDNGCMHYETVFAASPNAGVAVLIAEEKDGSGALRG